ncbi:MAG: RNA degradosome polyphosphate kinase, partial [Gaiellaceae bacterium]
MTDLAAPTSLPSGLEDAANPDAPPERLINRELSWLDFNGRVLDLVADSSQPLLERVRFCSIFSSNLDEFFMVRMAGLLRQEVAGVSVRSVDGRSAQGLLSDLRDRVLELDRRQATLWSDELVPELAAQGIVIGAAEDCSEAELRELENRFEREIYPILTPLAVGPGQPFPYISGLSLSLAALVRNPTTGEERLARVKVPEGLPRFLAIGDRGLLVPFEDAIRHGLDVLFPGMEILTGIPFRVTRDADFEVSDEADDLLEAVELELRRRRFGGVVRLEVSEQMPDGMLTQLTEGLDVGDAKIYRVGGMLDLADLSEIAK